ncbi:MAG TPA: FAD-dependent oxidoreductase [Thermoleophilaceae bacterium]|nr:FAD-dependent oxidoreductase [Thermoleophilaceae bacterium]
MAVMAGVLDDTRRRTLEALCDTIVPAAQYDGDDETMRAFMARSASDMGVAAQIEGLMAQAMLPEEIEGFGMLLDGLAQVEFATLPVEARTQVLKQVSASGPEAKLGVKVFKNLTLLFFYALPDEQGRNPNWDAIGYPGPISAPPSAAEAPKTIAVEELSGATATLTADVCVVGSGAGGGVLSAELAKAGKSVVVLEQGAYRNEQDFKQLELPGSLELYLGGGLLSSEDGSIAVLAGATLGGGTIVNYMNCIRTPEHIRAEWAEHGIGGIDGLEYEQHIDAVWERLQVNLEATSQNRPHRKLIQGMEACGFPWKPITRNADPSCDDPRVCGYCYTGCQRGCKQSTMKTYLQDASDAGAKFVVGARAERIVTADGRATGVEATVTNADGSVTKLTVEAPTVVVAAGSVESPALLLRSGIGGPAAGKHLRLHPAAIVQGVYDEPIEGWIGQAQSAVSYQFADCEGDWGFLIESAPTAPALIAANLPFDDGAQHKREFAEKLQHMAPFITVARDHGEGEVAIDAHGRAVVRWSLSDEIDRRMFVRGNQELAKLHRAAGATEIFTLHSERVAWRQGEDFDAFLEAIGSASYDANDVAVFTAHQLCSCRMGSDPAGSVADGRGELHDTKGVWIGDASAFPTAPGVNPMISIMSLAHRTAGEILKGE